MKITAGRAEGFVRRPDPAIHSVLVYGPDRGLVADRIERLSRLIVEDLSDPFRVSDLTGAAVARDGARLADELAAQSLTGGRRLVRVRDAGNDVAATIESLNDRSVADSYLIVWAGELAAGSALRQFFEKTAGYAALPCYSDDPGQVAEVVREQLAGHGLAADPGALDYLAEHLGQDRLVTRAEIEKLALYMGDETRVTEEHAAASVGDSAPMTLDALAVAVAGGDHARAARALRRLWMDGIAPVALVRALIRYFQRLHLVAGRIGRGQRIDDAVGGLRPPVHFRIATAFRRQAGQWSAGMAADALDRLLAVESACKTTGAPERLIVAAALLRLTDGARRTARSH